MREDRYTEDQQFRSIAEHLADRDAPQVQSVDQAAEEGPSKPEDPAPVAGTVDIQEAQDWESVDILESGGIDMNDQNLNPQAQPQQAPQQPQQAQPQQAYPGYQAPQQPQQPQQAYGQQAPQQPQQAYGQQVYEQQLYAPQQQPQRTGPSPVELYFKGILEQIKGFFSVDPANCLMATYKSQQKFLWAFWMPIFILLSSLSVFGVITGMLRSFVKAVVAAIPFGSMTDHIPLPTGRIYLACFLSFIIFLALHIGRCFLLSILGKQSPGALKVLDLSLASLMPYLLFGLLSGLLALLWMPLGILLMIPVGLLTELLIFTLAKREFGFAKLPAGNWIYLGLYTAETVLSGLLTWLIFSGIMSAIASM